MLAIKRPATGLLPKYFDKIIGKRAKVNIAKDEQIKWGKIR
jgi:sialic acid synthase SpsE